MSCLPIVERELRGAARHPVTYHLRTLGVGAFLAASVWFGLQNGFAPDLGGQLFGDLHLTLFGAIWLLVPLLTADCISRERREGTLGLLFLTRLRANQIVLAKGLVHGLRALTLWLAVIPVVTIPLLLGGITGQEATLSVLVNLGALQLALAAGLVASSLSRLRVRVLVYGQLLSLLFCVGLALVQGLWLQVLRSPGRPLAQFDHTLGLGFWGLMDWSGYWQTLPGPAGGLAQVTWLWASLLSCLCASLALVWTLGFSAWRLRRVWQEEPPSARLVWLEQRLAQPVLFAGLLQRWMRRSLQQNPVGWLETRRWQGRLVTWTWVGLIVCLYCWVSGLSFADTDPYHLLIAWMLVGSLALAAAGSFRRERETGVLELLLVSPLSEAQIISGRVKALWLQFLPASVALLFLWHAFGSIQGSPDARWLFFFGGAFVNLPVIGLYFSLRCRTFLAAFLGTLVAGLFLPLVLSALAGWLCWNYFDLLPYSQGILNSVGSSLSRFLLASLLISFRATLFLLLVAGVCYWRLLQGLRRRSFSFECAKG